MKMTLPILFGFSNLIFLILLIRSTLKGDSDRRFVIKVIACLHFLVLALWASLTVKTSANEVWILIGLGFAFLGDVALGLKHRSSRMVPIGLGLFLMTQGAYTLSFGIRITSLGLFACFLILILLLGYRIKKNPAYDFKGMDLAVFIYAVSMMLMLSSAVSAFLIHMHWVDLLKATGALLFVLSDLTLLQLYFRKPKQTRTILVYLILYHVAQNLLALSLWF